MKLYITSSPTGTYMRWDEKEFDGFNPLNGMVDRLWEDLWQPIRCLVISASPDSYEENDNMKEEFAQRIVDTGFELECIEVCDYRNCWEMVENLNEFSFIILGGGHVPTENAFFMEIGLREKIQEFDGVVMGISAGSMNCADIVYAQPEEEGESEIPVEERFIQGLGLTDINVLPHYNAVKDTYLDGKRLYEDITYPDSYGNTFFVITDGSYIYVDTDTGETQMCGEIYVLQDGQMEQIS